MARIKATIAKHPGEFVDGYELDHGSARKVPQNMCGRTLTMKEVEQLAKKAI